MVVRLLVTGIGVDGLVDTDVLTASVLALAIKSAEAKEVVAMGPDAGSALAANFGSGTAVFCIMPGTNTMAAKAIDAAAAQANRGLRDFLDETSSANANFMLEHKLAGISRAECPFMQADVICRREYIACNAGSCCRRRSRNIASSLDNSPSIQAESCSQILSSKLFIEFMGALFHYPSRVADANQSLRVHGKFGTAPYQSGNPWFRKSLRRTGLPFLAA